MNTLEHAAMQQALDALENAYENGFLTGIIGLKTIDTITALRDALEHPVSQEPVAWIELLREARDNCKASVVEEGISADRKAYRIDLEARLSAALNTAPQPVKEVELTDDEIAEAVGSPLDEVYLADFRAVIAAYKEKNK